jgi:hypothetical protein
MFEKLKTALKYGYNYDYEETDAMNYVYSAIGVFVLVFASVMFYRSINRPN